jgi:hypothetical protein
MGFRNHTCDAVMRQHDLLSDSLTLSSNLIALGAGPRVSEIYLLGLTRI